jgi:hypothetical protein
MPTNDLKTPFLYSIIPMGQFLRKNGHPYRIVDFGKNELCQMQSI